MGNITFYIRLYLTEVWNRKWGFMVVSWIFAILAITVVAFIPDKFRSVAKIYVDTDALLSTVVQKNTIVIEDHSKKAENIALLMYARPNIEDVIRNTPLHLDVNTPIEMENMVKKILDNLKIENPAKDVYNISYVHKDPKIAAEITQQILNKFIEENLGKFSKSSDSSVRYAERKVLQLKEKAEKLQKEATDYRTANIQVLQDKTFLYNDLNKYREILKDYPAEIANLKTRLGSLQRQLAETPKFSKNSINNSNPSCNLDELESIIAGLRARGLTEEHPDIKYYTNVYQQRKAACKNIIASGGGDSNPAYGQIRSNIEDTELTISRMKIELENARDGLSKVETVLKNQPPILEKLTSLETSKEIALKELRGAEEDLEKVRETVNANRQETLINYEVYEKPIPPQLPESPNRLILLLGGFFASLAAAAGFTFLRIQTSENMPTLQHLKQHFDLPILGSISYVPAQGDMVQNVKENTLWFTSLGLLVLLFVFMIWYFHIMMKRPDFSQIYQDFYFLLSSVI